jgi:hypothetical protein
MNNNGNKKKQEVNINEMYEDYDMNVDYPENQNKRYAGVDVNNQTIINLNSNQPIGIDLNKFVSNINNCDQTMHSISTSNDLPIISEVKQPINPIGKRTAPVSQRHTG